jgi:predicted transcriptional regulator
MYKLCVRRKHMLKALFSSNTRVKLLIIFLKGEDNEFFIRELTRLLNEQINSIRRELNNLKKIGLLKCRSRNRKKYYSVNPDFLLLEDLKSMVEKCTDPKKELVRKMQKLGKIDLVLFSGAFVNSASQQIDLLVVGDMDKEDLTDLLRQESKQEKDIRFAYLSRDDFLYRIKLNDKFIVDMLKDTDNIVAVNKLSSHLEKVLGKEK